MLVERFASAQMMRFETRNGGAQDKDGDSECKSRIRWFRLVRRSRELRKYTGKVLKLISKNRENPNYKNEIKVRQDRLRSIRVINEKIDIFWLIQWKFYTLLKIWIIWVGLWPGFTRYYMAFSMYQYDMVFMIWFLFGNDL